MKRILNSIRNKICNTLEPACTVRHCPICNWKGKKFSIGGATSKQRIDARCPQCGSLERHRLAFLTAEKSLDLDYSHVIHVAPERELSKWLSSKSGEYLSIDLYADAMVKMDITNLKLDDNSQSLFWASHVLEHVIDDSKAISEIHRILTPGGKAFVQVPIWRLETFEEPSATTPEQRLELFYQEDHVRLYGLDIMDRFREQGFEAALYRAQDFGPTNILQHGLSFASTDEVFVFTK